MCHTTRWDWKLIAVLGYLFVLCCRRLTLKMCWHLGSIVFKETISYMKWLVFWPSFPVLVYSVITGFTASPVELIQTSVGAVPSLNLKDELLSIVRKCLSSFENTTRHSCDITLCHPLVVNRRNYYSKTDVFLHQWGLMTHNLIFHMKPETNWSWPCQMSC